MNPEELIALRGMFTTSNTTISDLADEQHTSLAELRNMDRMSTISTLGSLLALPSLQANACRIEALVHIAMVRAEGRQHPSSTFTQNAFESFGHGTCGRLEDPAEDLFSSTVHCRNGNYTVFEGLREGNGFYLQRVLDVIEDMPEKEPFIGLRRAVFALLTLSDAAAGRAGVLPRVVGAIKPISTLPEEVVARMGSMFQWVLFNANDPELLRVELDDLRPFVFDISQHDLLPQSLGHTSLERYPVLQLGDMYCLALPTAVGSAVTRYTLEMVKSLGMMDAFETVLEREYWNLLLSTPFIPAREKAHLDLQRQGTLRVRSVINEVDPGRYLHLVISNEAIEDIETVGFAEVSPACMEQSRIAVEQAHKASEIARQRSGFRDGITLVIGCGLGRASVFVAEALPENWRIEYIPVHDALTMAWMEDFSPLDLWRILDSKAALDSAGIFLVNCNGLLNLFAWANDLKGHLVPHGDIPESFRTTDARRLIFVNQNAVLELRRNTQRRYHTLVALNEDHVFRRVRRIGESVFSDDQEAPLYIDEQALRDGSLKAVYIAANRFWWMEIEQEEDGPKNEIYEHWKMLCVWLQRTAPVLEETYVDLLPPVLTFRIRFHKIVGTKTGSIDLPMADELKAAFETSIERTRAVITIRVGDAFDNALASPENIAECHLIEALIEGVSELVNSRLEAADKSKLLTRICPSDKARSRHMMPAQNFRDMVRRGSGKPVSIHLMDDGLSRLGLAFRVQSDVEREVKGKLECTSFLNSACKQVLEELCSFLKLFNRKKFIEIVLENHESAAISREWWRRTAHANIALHGDRAVGVIAEHVAEMNACSIASRILIEAAICECPVDGGALPGELDLSRAMAKAIFAFHVGGWSDGVHWGAIAPRVRITPLGDIHINHTFMDTIYSPFVQSGGVREVNQAVDSYQSAYVEPQTVRSVEEIIEPAFLRAWKREYGVSVDDLRRFIDELENIGIKLNSLWFERRRSELSALLARSANLQEQEAVSTIKLLTLPNRSRWMSAPVGFRDKDWQPWRFRRRLSLVRRPFIEIEEAPDPRIIIAPALAREALYILLRSFYSGETPDWQVASVEMRKWLGHTNNVERTAFNGEVASRLRELGWRSEPDYRITKLLGVSLDRDYGDVDALAWNPDSGRVLAVECKDLQFHKTLGEVAEQLSDFRGVVRPDGKRDLLRKHLDRLAIMREHKVKIAARLGLRSEVCVQGHIVFRHPVPMQFAWEQMQQKIGLLLFDQLDTLRFSD